MYKDVKRKEVKKGIKAWRNELNEFFVVMLHYTADEEKDPEREGAEWFKAEKKGTPKAVWEKEFEIGFETKSGELVYGPEYCDFTVETHTMDSIDVSGMELFMGLDFGQRNPNGAIIGAIDKDNHIYLIDEYYNPAIPSVASKEMFSKFGYLMPGYSEEMSIDDKRALANSTFQIKVIDPSTGSKNRSKIIEGEEIPYSVIEDFYDNGWEFERGINDWDPGVTRVREYFSFDPQGIPYLRIFADKCPGLLHEMLRYRYQENTESAERKNNQPERPVKKNDHLMDALRYLIMTRPNKPQDAPKKLTRIQKDIQGLLRPVIQTDLFDID